MTFKDLLFRSLRYHARAHLGVVLGATVGSAALIGALLVGDSVKASLRGMALERLGKVEAALASNDRLFRDSLAGELQAALDVPVMGVLQVPGTAVRADGAARANAVQVLGVEQDFWELATRRAAAPAMTNGVLLNGALARQLDAEVGDEILIRAQKPSQLSREAPISPQEDFNVALRVTVAGVLSGEALGNFSLQANQVPPFNVFVPRRLLQAQLQATNRANLLLVSGSNRQAAADDPATGGIASKAQAALRAQWQLADASLSFIKLTNQPGYELRSQRVFLDAPVIAAARAAAPEPPLEILTYFVNDLRIGERATPYSMVSGLGASALPEGMADDEILVSPWLVEDLQAQPGQSLELTYFIVANAGKLETRTRQFRVRAAVPFAGIFADGQLMPEFPGVAQAESSQDWDAGFPIDLGRIRDKDEDYWKAYRGTPKAFVTLQAAHQMWTNRFGELTALRFLANDAALALVPTNLLTALAPPAVGLTFQPVREQALAASGQAMNFGQLFIGFSFFLILAALILMALLFQFGLEQRAAEIGTLLALGFTPGKVRRLMLLEGAALAIVGGLCGMAGAVLYARAMLYGLATIWRDSVSTDALTFAASPATLLTGFGASVLVAVLTIAWVLRKQARQPARELMEDSGGTRLADAGKRRAWPLLTGMGAALAAAGLIIWTVATDKWPAPQVFFGVGALLLTAGLAFTASFFDMIARGSVVRRPTLSALAWRNITRRRGRSLATVILLACGSFIIVAVGANKLDSNRDATRRSAGTGGFALLGQSALPVMQDLNTAAGMDFFGLDSNDLSGVSLVAFRVKPGDDASCLNLNRAQTPRLLGVQPASLAERKAFSFAKVLAGLPGEDPWTLLQRDFGPDVVPAIADQASIQWALGKKLGDTLTFLDDQGRPFEVKLVAGLANSVLQGSLIIAEDQFVRRFPQESGYSMFLVDAPADRIEAVAETLSRAMQDAGLEAMPTAERLAAFNAVQNTYLNTFQVLGGLGLLLGTAGLGVVVLRNVLERRSEIALLQAVGYRRNILRRLVLLEHAGLLLLGLGVGLVAALVAVLPVLLAPEAQTHYWSLILTLVGVLVSGLIWTSAATRLALRGELLAALRNE